MRKLQILTLVLVVLIISNFVGNLVPQVMHGFATGWELSEKNLEHFRVTLRPKGDCEAMETDHILFDGTPLAIKLEDVDIFLPETMTDKLTGDRQILHSVINICSTLLAFPILGLLIWMLALIVKLFKSVFRSQFFAEQNIQYINKIAWILIVTETIGGILLYINTYSMLQMIELQGYEVSYANYFSSNIILGMIMLVMNEFIRMAITMKKEQELTI